MSIEDFLCRRNVITRKAFVFDILEGVSLGDFRSGAITVDFYARCSFDAGLTSWNMSSALGPPPFLRTSL
jgi:hypothetical protein